MTLRGLVRLCHPPLSSYCDSLTFGRERGGYGPTGSGAIVSPSSLLLLGHSSVRKLKWRVLENGVGYCWAPTLTLDTAFSPHLTRA